MTPQDTPTPQKDMKVLLQMNEQLATTNAKLERSLAAAQAALRLVLDYPGVTEHVGSIITDIAQEALTPQEGERDD
jgi:hypothetical protein